MREADRTFVRMGLGELLYQTLSEDMKELISQEVADRKANDYFVKNFADEKRKFKMFVATLDGSNDSPVGFVSVAEVVNPDVDVILGAIFDLYVTEDQRKKGIGSQLLDHALAYLKSQGYAFVNIQTAGTNDNALHLYTKKRIQAGSRSAFEDILEVHIPKSRKNPSCRILTRTNFGFSCRRLERTPKMFLEICHDNIL